MKPATEGSESRAHGGLVYNLGKTHRSVLRDLREAESVLARAEERVKDLKKCKSDIEAWHGHFAKDRIRSPRDKKQRDLTSKEKTMIRRRHGACRSDETWRKVRVPQIAKQLDVSERQVTSVIAGVVRSKKAKPASRRSGPTRLTAVVGAPVA